MKKFKSLYTMVILIFLISFWGNIRRIVSADSLEMTKFDEIEEVQDHLYLPLVMVPENFVADEIGPSGGTFPALIIDKANPNNIFIGTWGAGIYKSVDFGVTWSAINDGITNLKIQSLGMDPLDSQIIYAGTYGSGLFKSLNGGIKWNGSSAGVLGNHIIYDIEIALQQPQIIYTASRISGSLVGYVHKSINGGVSWQLMMKGDLFDTDDYFYDIDVNPDNANQVFLATHEHGFFRSDDGGQNWYAVNQGVTDLSGRSLVFDPELPSTVFGGVWHGVGVYKSSDSGGNWIEANSGFPNDVEVYRLVIDPQSNIGNRRIYACTYEDGLFRSDNSALSWTYNGLNGKFIYDFGISQSTPQKIYASTYLNGLLKSVDGGSNWQTSDEGIYNTNVTGLASLSAYPNKLFASIFGEGIFKTEDCGVSWQAVNTGISDLEINSLLVLDQKLFALSNSSIFYSETGESWTGLEGPSVQNYSQNHLLFTNQIDYDLPEDVIFFKKDHEFKTSSNLSSNSSLVSLTKANGILIGGTPGFGIWAYINGIWNQIGLDSRWIYTLSFDKLLNRLLVGSCHYDLENGLISDCRVNIGENQAGSWIWMDLNEGLAGIKANHLLVRGDDYFAATNNGIYIRDNDGTNWIPVGGLGKNVLIIAIDPLDARKLYAGAETGALLSEDFGLTWATATTNLAGKRIQTVSVDLVDNNAIYFGSNNRGAYCWNR